MAKIKCQKFENLRASRFCTRTFLKKRILKNFAVEIMSLQSCALYEFRITAVSKYGESKPMVLVQYTGT